MTRDEAKVLPRGLYRISWKQSHGGGSSVAAIGSTGNGNRWMAPTNWVGFSTDDDKIADSWDAVERVQIIEETDTMSKTAAATTSSAMKAANDDERVLLRGVIKRSSLVTKEEWTECPCGWFYVGKLCPDEKCKVTPKLIKTKLYAHVDDGDQFHNGRELGLSQAAAEKFSGWGYELEFEAEVNPKTGDVKLISVDGHKIQY